MKSELVDVVVLASMFFSDLSSFPWLSEIWFMEIRLVVGAVPGRLVDSVLG